MLWRLARLKLQLKQIWQVMLWVGLGDAVRHALRLMLARERIAELSFRPRGVQHPLVVRAESSDWGVFEQIFALREYACLDGLKGVKFIVDCGANVGYSSAYFLSRYPGSHIVAIEPDPGNFGVLQQNLAPYGERAKALQAGVWSHPAGLRIADVPYRDGEAWSKQVRECLPDEESQIAAIDICSVLAQSGFDRISVLKIDVEGAEVVIFSQNYESWLAKVDVIAIELHDDSTFGSGTKAFFAAIEGRGFAITTSGELTICQRQPGT